MSNTKMSSLVEAVGDNGPTSGVVGSSFAGGTVDCDARGLLAAAGENMTDGDNLM